MKNNIKVLLFMLFDTMLAESDLQYEYVSKLTCFSNKYKLKICFC